MKNFLTTFVISLLIFILILFVYINFKWDNYYKINYEKDNKYYISEIIQDSNFIIKNKGFVSKTKCLKYNSWISTSKDNVKWIFKDTLASNSILEYDTLKIKINSLNSSYNDFNYKGKLFNKDYIIFFYDNGLVISNTE